MPVSQASSLFDAEFSVFTHQETGQQSVRTLAYSIPAALSGHLDFVHPTITYALAALPRGNNPKRGYLGSPIHMLASLL